MEAPRIVGFVLLGLLVLALAGCGQGRSHEGLSAPTPGATPAVASGELGALPQLSALPAATHKMSLVGPGWAAIAPQETIATGHSSLGPGEALTLNAAGGMAYAIYGIAGFNGDNGPTSARITQSSMSGPS